MARMKASGRLTVLFVALLVAAMPSRAAGAEELNFRRNVGDFWVYLSVMPADFISGPAASAPGATPFQPPAARDTHHLMVAIFDYRTGRRITEAAVEARVAALGFSGTKPSELRAPQGEGAERAQAMKQIARGPAPHSRAPARGSRAGRLRCGGPECGATTPVIPSHRQASGTTLIVGEDTTT